MSNKVLFGRGTTANYTAHLSETTSGDTIYFTKPLAGSAFDSLHLGGDLVATSKIENMLSSKSKGSIFYTSGPNSGNPTQLTELSVGTQGYVLKVGQNNTLQWAEEYSYTHPTSGVTAGDYGPDQDKTIGTSTTFTVPSITVDANGHITAASNKTMTMNITLPTVPTYKRLLTDRDGSTQASERTTTNGNTWIALLSSVGGTDTHVDSFNFKGVDGIEVTGFKNEISIACVWGELTRMESSEPPVSPIQG